MNVQRRVAAACTIAISMLAITGFSVADDVTTVAVASDAAVVVIEAEGDAAADTPVVVRVETTAAGQAVVFQSGGRGFGNYSVRQDVDPQDAVERFALLLPGGPIIVEATMTIDGESFRQRREALIDEMMAAGDTDEDGVLTWDEALGSPRFTYGRIIPEQQRAGYLDGLDQNQNGEVERAEARGFLAVSFQGPAFNIAAGGYSARGRGGALISVNGLVLGGAGGQADVRTLLDVDSDGVLSESEIAGASERLKSRDADDNDLLYTQEIGGGTNTGARNLQVVVNGQRQRQRQPQQAILLGPATSAETVFNAIRDKYQTEESDGVVGPDSFYAVPELFNQLDTDNDESLSQSEVMGLNEVTPHARLTAEIGIDGGESNLTLTDVNGQEAGPGDAEDIASLDLPGATVKFTASSSPVRNYNFDVAAQRILDQYDSDNNEYLERSELAENVATQFDSWDADSDGMVYKKEIEESYARGQAPQQTQVQARVTKSGDPLFPALDLSGDSRLSLREMRTAAIQLAALDENGDGQITQDEVPVTYSVNLGLGNSGYGFSQVIRATGRGGATTAASSSSNGPDWFVRMDRNGDGDVTLKEFLGGRTVFEEIDANGDGFIEPAEAEAASQPEANEE